MFGLYQCLSLTDLQSHLFPLSVSEFFIYLQPRHLASPAAFYFNGQEVKGESSLLLGLHSNIWQFGFDLGVDRLGLDPNVCIPTIDPGIHVSDPGPAIF